jgi:hypothetical protein
MHSQVVTAIAQVRTALAGDDPQLLRQALDRLAEVTRPLAEIMMNAVVAATLKDKSAINLKPEDV